MSLVTNISNLATRTATELKSHRTLINGNVSDLTSLLTTNKTNLVSAINELKSTINALPLGAQIDDTQTASTTTTWSTTKTQNMINAAITALTNGAPTALDTLQELANALGNDSNFSATVTLALANRVRSDIANQGLTTTQQSNARTNIATYGTTDIGDITVDFVALFNTGLS